MASLKSYALFRDPQGRITAKESSAKSALWLQKWLFRQRDYARARNGWCVHFVVWRAHAWVDEYHAEAPALSPDVTLYARVEELDFAMAAAKARLGGGA